MLMLYFGVVNIIRVDFMSIVRNDSWLSNTRRLIVAPGNRESGGKGPLCSEEVMKLSNTNAGKAS